MPRIKARQVTSGREGVGREREKRCVGRERRERRKRREMERKCQVGTEGFRENWRPGLL